MVSFKKAFTHLGVVDFVSFGVTVSRFLNLIVVMPIVLVLFSSDEVVLWLSFATLLQMLLYVDFGFTPVFIRLFARERAVGELDRMYALGAFSKCTNDILLILGGVFLFVFVPDYYKTLGATDKQSLIMAGCLFASFLGVMKGNVYKALLEGFGYVMAVRLIELIVSISQVVVVSLLLLVEEFWLALMGLSASYLLFFFLYYMVYLSKVASSGGLSILGWGEVAGFMKKKSLFSLFVEVWGQAWRGGVSLFSSLGVISFVLLEAVALMDSIVAAVFLIIFNYSRTGYNVCLMPFYNRIPYLSSLFVLNKMDYWREVFNLLRQTSLFLICFYVLFVILFPYVFNFIKSEAYSLGYLLIIGSSGVVMLERIQAVIMQAFSTSQLITWHKNNLIYGAAVLCGFYSLLGYFPVHYSLILSMLLASVLVLVKLVVKDVGLWVSNG